MIERHVTFKVYPDRKSEFVKLFVEEYRPAMSGMPGFGGAELLSDPNHPDQYQMVIRFQSSQAAASWRSSAAHAALQPKIQPFYSLSELQVFEVVA